MLTLTFLGVHSVAPAHHSCRGTQLPVLFISFKAYESSVSGAAACLPDPLAQASWIHSFYYIYSAIRSKLFTVIIWPGGVFQPFIWKAPVLTFTLYSTQILAGSQH